MMASTASSAAAHTAPEKAVIAGAGIVGISTAYYLAVNHKISSTVIDPTGTVAPAASGKAAGFLARDWRDGTPLQRLCKRSFDLHQEIANKVGSDKIQYRRVTSAFVQLDNAESKKQRSTNRKRKLTLEWVDPTIASQVDLQGDKSTLAQVHPKLLCEHLWEATKQAASDVKLVRGSVVGHVHDKDGNFVGAKLQNGSVVHGDALLYACGPWTCDKVTGSKAHSVLMKTDQVQKQCIFFTDGPNGDFEAFVRPDQTVFLSGFDGGEEDVQVAERPGEETVDSKVIQALVESMNMVTSSASCPQPGRACYQPTTPDDLPIMGESLDRYCYVAAGHSCWGILMGPATGETMANLIATGRKSTSHVNLRPFDPLRFGEMQMVSKNET